MAGNPHPVSEITGITTTADVSKAAFVAFVKSRSILWVADAQEIRDTDLAGQNWLALGSAGTLYKLDTSDTTTGDDGVDCIRDANGHGYFLLSINNGVPAGTYEPLGQISGVVNKADDFTFALTDKGKLVHATKATAMTGTVPPNSSVAFPLYTRIDLSQYGAGQFSIAEGAGVTIRSADSYLKLRTQYSGACLVQISADEWELWGDLAA